MQVKPTTAVAVVAFAVILSACGGHSRKSEASTPEAAITGFSDKPSRVDASFANVTDQLLRDRAGLRSAALAHFSDANPNARYAALYALALAGKGPVSTRMLTSALASPDEDRRILAGMALIGTGVKASIPVLIAELASAHRLAFGEPPVEAWEAVRPNLLRYTHQDFGLRRARTPRDARLTTAAWRRWWSLHATSLRWSVQKRSYVG
jgi:hypothetical protein